MVFSLTSMHPIKASLLALLLFVLVLSLHLRFVEPTLEGLAVTSSSPAFASGGSGFLLLSDAVLPGNNSLINFSNGVYRNVGTPANYTFTLGVLYNSDGNGNTVQLNHYKLNGSSVALISLGTGIGTGLTLSGMATTELASGEYVQLVYGAQVYTLLTILPGSSYSIIRIPQ